jgi:hypothetical protein
LYYVLVNPSYKDWRVHFVGKNLTQNTNFNLGTDALGFGFQRGRESCTDFAMGGSSY